MTQPSFAQAQAIPVRSGTDRATLVRRTYGVVFLGVIITCLGAAFTMTQPALIEARLAHPFISIICLMAPLFLVMRNPRQFPQNIVLTGLFTFAEGVFLAPFLLAMEQNQPGVVSQAAVLTLTTFGGLSLYALVSKRDFSAWGQFFMIGLVVLVVTMIINMFVQSVGAGLWISAAGVLVFSGLLVFDTWRLLRSGAYGPDDYVPAAVMIYLDLLNMFLFILSLLGGGRRR
jgi:modulator of FtsH protease